MLGAIAGDIIGSRFEWSPVKTTEFDLFHRDCQFTDDSVLTCAVAEALMDGGTYADALRRWARRYPDAGYGGSFRSWMECPGAGPYNSWGNGSAMRVSPVAWLCDTEEAALMQARASAVPTHDHPEGIRGAEAVALGIFMARRGASREEVGYELQSRFGYDLSTPLEDIRPWYQFDVSCPGSVPPAIRAFLEATDYESAVRNAISLGGDADTQAAIAGSLAEACWGVPEPIRAFALGLLTPDMRELLARFERHIGITCERGGGKA
ncbi:MAG: ADP-ribosylglycohydrolase family protein [Deltaproteobacteria bacterium]|nr:MAG: ADP-ribosylglycohydrolase family protein [Deltaproteobacteria bacterium]